MSTREDRILTNVATAIGSTLGAVAAEADKIKDFVTAQEHVIAKKARRAGSRASIATRRTKRAIATATRRSKTTSTAAKRRTKTAAKRVRRAVTAGKRGLKRAAGRRTR
jgi:hypothetical protein